uniref:Uncharacterized protein n=1 Tax=Tetranychus urticae TaxID=32264 RepID=T1JU95_TETUR
MKAQRMQLDKCEGYKQSMKLFLDSIFMLYALQATLATGLAQPQFIIGQYELDRFLIESKVGQIYSCPYF